MNVSQLIKELERFKAEYGDTKVYCVDSDNRYSPDTVRFDIIYIEDDNDEESEISVCSLE